MIPMKLFGVESQRDATIAATGVTLGFTHFWPIGVSIIIGLFIWRKWYFRYDWLLIGITIPILITGIWGDLGAAVSFFIIACTLFALWHSPLNKRYLWIGVNAWLFVLTILSIIEITVLNDPRPETLFVKDASILGLAGFSFMNILAGVAGSRTAVLGLWLFAFFTQRRVLFIVALTATVYLLLPTTMNLDGADRVFQINKSYSQRFDLIDHAPSLRLFGVGYHDYVNEYQLQRPHNIYVLSIHELGLFAWPFWSLVIVTCFFIPKRVVLIVGILGLFTDEWLSRPEGLFMIFGVVLSSYVFPSKLQRVGRFSYILNSDGNGSRSSKGYDDG